MTQTAKYLILTVLALVAGLIIGTGIAALADEMTTEVPAQSAPAADVQRLDLDPAAVSRDALEQAELPTWLPGGADLNAGQLAQAELAADRVCEALTAGVPMAELTTALMAEQNLTGEQAREFANAVALERC